MACRKKTENIFLLLNTETKSAGQKQMKKRGML